MGTLGEILMGLVCRDGSSWVGGVPVTFGRSSPSLSRRLKRASAKMLAELAKWKGRFGANCSMPTGSRSRLKPWRRFVRLMPS